jgi:hypothetical protein
MPFDWIVAGDARRRGASLPQIAACVALGLLVSAAGAAAQSRGQVRVSLLEASAGEAGRSCTLEVLLDNAAGEATLSCERRTPPVSHLAAHRALTTTEVARLSTLASARASSRSPKAESSALASADGAQVTVTIERDDRRVMLDASRGTASLSANERQLLGVLRGIADGLRGGARR